MNRKEFLSLTSVALASQCFAQQESNDEWPKRDVLNLLFRQNSEYFRKYFPASFEKIPLNIENDSWIGKPNAADHAGEPYLWVSNPAEQEGDVYGIIQVGKTGHLISAGAHVKKLSNKSITTVPKLEMNDAIKRASERLKIYGWEISRDMQLDKVHYSFGGAWEIAWHRTFDGVLEIKNDVELDTLEVILNEDDDGLRFTRWRRGPAPAKTIPKLSRSEGMEAAAKAVPQIMATDIYQSWMPKGLSAIELKQFELCVTVPNWILDAKRYAECPSYPTERRLCWRGTYLLYRRDKAGEKDGHAIYNYMRGFLYVMIDAVSGEVIGGNMEPVFNDGVSQKFGNK